MGWKGSLESILNRLFKINDSPQKVALGLGLGVFTGILPGTGPLAALFLASLLRLNRASAFLGSLITNTWLSIITFVFAVKLGALSFGVQWQDLYQGWKLIFSDFHWQAFLKASVLKVLLPVMTGYIEISLFLGLLAYISALIIIKSFKTGSCNVLK